MSTGDLVRLDVEIPQETYDALVKITAQFGAASCFKYQAMRSPTSSPLT